MNCEISGWDQFWRYGFFSLFAEDVLVKEVGILLFMQIGADPFVHTLCIQRLRPNADSFAIHTLQRTQVPLELDSGGLESLILFPLKV